MSSIYNTSHSPVKGRGRGIPPQRHGPMGMPGQRPPMRRPMTQQQQQQQAAALNIPYNDFQLMSCKRRGKNHVMDFKTAKKVDFNNFARPVKLQRKEGNQMYNRFANRGSPSNSATAQAATGGTAGANASNAASPSTSNVNSSNGTPNGEASGSQTPQQQQHQHGPKTGADTSLIAPLGGATRNKQMLFKKRTKQIYLAKEDTRQLKEEEHKPWILEDYDGQNSFTGTYEGGQRSDYVFFVVSGNDFKVVPVDRWYKFQAKRNFRTFTLEEAEEQLKSQQKREQNRWMMLKRNKAIADDEDEAKVSTKVKRRASDDEDESGRQKSRHDSDIDDLDFDDVFQDDEEGGAEHEAEDEDVKDSKERLKRETKGYTLGGEDDDDDQQDTEDLNKLTSEGKQMKKLVRNLEKNRAYDSDEEGDPYASSEDEVDSEAEKEESKSDAEGSQKDQQQKDQKKTTPAKKKGPVPGSKAGLHKKGLAAKVKKEGLSKPIGRPGSPSMQQVKQHAKSPSPPPPRQASPSAKAAVHSSREASPVSAASSAASTKKRKLEDGANSPDGKHHRSHQHHRPTATSPGGPASSTTAGGGSADDLITEEEVIATLRGKRMTTKEFLMHFRKRIKKNASNRDIITGLLKKVARHNTTDDPNTRVLELRPELH
ncbi:hypothetical protein BDB00DRAFT_853846 [Zychaea mexicana]|uniref:uncharacterized protein n=1 Tax=Zychaea mexicana TaxID=64656 RepID=UPI0022FEB793|nr:uncharacterized protein BDB00DRAFT_853846 [Zychaea mexicana]KAI9484739.1 hypothetical protein BDB00DRAFT_853846 [Zychaea mexicana]